MIKIFMFLKNNLRVSCSLYSAMESKVYTKQKTKRTISKDKIVTFKIYTQNGYPLLIPIILAS
jgi:hypothetical protein